MTRLLIDDKAIELMKKALAKENAKAMRIFMSGGGCCKLFEIAAVKKALTGDITFRKNEITIYIEKELVDNTSIIEIKFDEQKGLLIDFK